MALEDGHDPSLTAQRLGRIYQHPYVRVSICLLIAEGRQMAN